MLQFIVNDRKVNTDCPPGMVALDFIREQLKLTGTKEGCKEGECGACTVLTGELQNEGYIKYQDCGIVSIAYWSIERVNIL